MARAEKSFLDMIERRFAARPDVPSWPSASHRPWDRPRLLPDVRCQPLPSPVVVERDAVLFKRARVASATYTIPLALRVRGVLDRAALEAAVGDLVERHESLRTIFPDTLGVPRQLILDAVAARPRLAVTCGRSGAFGSVVCCDAHRV